MEENLPNATIRKQDKLQLNSKYVPLYPQISVILTPNQGNFCLEQRERPLLKTTTNQNEQLQRLVLMNTKQLLHLRLNKL